VPRRYIGLGLALHTWYPADTNGGQDISCRYLPRCLVGSNTSTVRVSSLSTALKGRVARVGPVISADGRVVFSFRGEVGAG